MSKVVVPYKGLNMDSAPNNQPEGTVRFALNANMESSDGDFGKYSTEEKNEYCYSLPVGFVSLGRINIGDNEIMHFLVNNKISEIGMSKNCEYTTIINDAGSVNKLDFNIEFPIDIEYRLRRGCEKVVYFTDHFNVPRYLNLAKLDDFKKYFIDSSWIWDANKFKLQKTYSKVPLFKKFEVVQNGNLKAGSYNIAIRYLDEDFNPTEWITSSETINIYHDSISKVYSKITGSTGEKNFYQDYQNTDKSIRVELDYLDENYLYYQLGVIVSNIGFGTINEFNISEQIPIELDSYVISGFNNFEQGDVNEVYQFSNIIERAKHIAQIDNQLLLANVAYKDVPFCNFQKYASNIQADLALKEIVLNRIVEGNPKNAVVNTQIVGETPGEIRSYGIVYVFEDGYSSPVFHIPGKSKKSKKTVLSSGTNIYPMSVDNECEDYVYTEVPSQCNNNLWGLDSEGDILKGKKIRHHRFPLRGEIGIPLYEKIENTSEIKLHSLNFQVSGEISSAYLEQNIYLKITYTIDSSEFTTNVTFNRDIYETGYNINVIESSSNNMTITSIEELDSNEDPATTGLSYSSGNIEETIFDSSKNLYKTNIMGIKFSNIEFPDLEEAKGNKIIGYYIVANEVDEENKTILDTAVLTPVVKGKDGFATSAYHSPRLDPTGDKHVMKDVFGFINPQFKFTGREFTNVNEIIQDGVYKMNKPELEITMVNLLFGLPASYKDFSWKAVFDVALGSSFNPEVHRAKEADADGFQLVGLSRDIDLTYESKFKTLFSGDEIQEMFYLSSLFNNPIETSDGETTDVFNISSDNKIGILHLKEDTDKIFQEKHIYPNNWESVSELPFVIFKRNIRNPYGNFRSLRYYKYSRNLETLNTCTIFNGNSYVNPIRYTSSMYYDTKIADRKKKSSVIRFVTGALSLIAGVLIAVGTIGVGATMSAPLISFGLSQLASGFQMAQMNHVYDNLYDKGLRETFNDYYTVLVFSVLFGRTLKDKEGNVILKKDDTIQWYSETLTNLWFESDINIGLRLVNTKGLTNFLYAPENSDPEQAVDYLIEKITEIDLERDEKRRYIGYAKAELYLYNKDYQRRNKEKIYYHIPVEYECCSECNEVFTDRIHKSMQSFSEERTDNGRVFLPNDYLDIPGETGEITDVFVITNNIFIHTKEALWQLPRNHQERVTDQIVSFIGTGDYFSIPPQKLLDSDTGNSAGSYTKYGKVKNKFGIFFPSELSGEFYKFDGKQLDNLSLKGMNRFFKNEMKDIVDNPFYDNLAVPQGTGFTIGYDSNYERLLVTKKDYKISRTDLHFCNGDYIEFPNLNQTITQQNALGFNYVGIEDCKLKFSRQITKTRWIPGEEQGIIKSDTTIIVIQDTSGSFTKDARDTIKDSVVAWANTYALGNNWNGQLGFIDDYTERVWRSLDFIKGKVILDKDDNPITVSNNIIIINFTNEARPDYHTATLEAINEEPNFIIDHAQHKTDYQELINNGGSFFGLIYPIVFPEGQFALQSVIFLRHVMAALKGEPFTQQELDAMVLNNFVKPEYHYDFKRHLLNHPLTDGLSQYGWRGEFRRGWDTSFEPLPGFPGSSVITPEQFQEDIATFLEGEGTTITDDIEVEYLETEYKYIEGTVIEDVFEFNKSFTLSYSFKLDAWVSFHSYMPNYYISLNSELYSSMDSGVFRHNVKEHYLTYYGIKYPFIIEQVIIDNAIETDLNRSIMFNTDAQRHLSGEEVEERNITFNKAILYNSRQNTGLLTLRAKEQTSKWFMKQTENLNTGEIPLKKTNKDWSFNRVRDIRIDYTRPMWISDKAQLQDKYYIDKRLNETTMSNSKNWTQQEKLRDKYLILRLIFDNFADIKLISNFYVNISDKSNR